MKWKIIILCTVVALQIFFEAKASSTINLAESHGSQLSMSIDSNTFTFHTSNERTTVIKLRASSIRADFFDGSYLILNNNGTITRYSAKTNRTESYTTNSQIVDWDVRADVRAIVQEMFTYQAEVVDVSSRIVGGDCYWEGGAQVCRPRELSPFTKSPLKSDTFSIKSVASSSGNSCTFEQNQAARPWAGHSSRNQCMMGSRITYAAVGLATLGACSFPNIFTWLATCPATYAGWVGTTYALDSRSIECDNSYDAAMHNLARCESNNQNATSPAWSSVPGGGFTTEGGSTILYGGFSFNNAGGGSGGTCIIRHTHRDGTVTEARVSC